ncbi:MAG: SRPBCC family protein [Methylococcales bacterium]|nr:SRPBCC family protein [Methylococcales bacterium]
MKKIVLIVPLLWIIYFETQALDSMRIRIKATVVIDATADKVWNVIKNYNDMSWHPTINNIKIDDKNKKGSIRILTLKDGGTITQELKNHDAKEMSFNYKTIEMSVREIFESSRGNVEIPTFPVGFHSAKLSVKNENGKAIVTWNTAYYPLFGTNNYFHSPIPKEINIETANKAIILFLKTGLTHLLKKFDANGNESSVSFFCIRGPCFGI